jgi:hypothetical protein
MEASRIDVTLKIKAAPTAPWYKYVPEDALLDQVKQILLQGIFFECD